MEVVALKEVAVFEKVAMEVTCCCIGIAAPLEAARACHPDNGLWQVPKPGPGEILVKSGAVGMCGTDYHAYDVTERP